ncbi:enoyl-CoA hydratase/isomerase domain-containing protein [Sarocladium implicatum]|nr:enoyl-CoA hydratase/isomerase domain-containing protein [Sarocladium implicatum]
MSQDYSSFTLLTVTFPSPPIAHVQLNRPAKLNAFSHALWLEFGRVFRLLDRDSDVRAVVLSGAGDRAFCAGLDVKDAAGDEVMTGGQEDGARWAWKVRRERIEVYQESVSAVEECSKPVICVLHGACIGLAIDIACCADIRLAASNALFSVKEVDIGMAADVGTLARLPKIVGNHSWVKDVCLTAREFDSREASTVGFVSQVLESKEQALRKALEIAGVLAEKSPVAVQSTKELLNHGREHGVQEALKYTAVWNSAALQGADFMEALKARVVRKKPTFAKL